MKNKQKPGYDDVTDFFKNYSRSSFAVKMVDKFLWVSILVLLD